MAIVEVEVKGLDKLKRLAERYPAVASKHTDAAIKRSLVRIWGEVKREAPFGVSGGLRDRWILETAPFRGTLRSGVHYAAAVHGGTAPHPVPVSAIAPWARKKGLNPYAVAASIKKKGTKANPFLERAVDKSLAGVQKEFATAIQLIMAELTK